MYMYIISLSKYHDTCIDNQTARLRLLATLGGLGKVLDSWIGAAGLTVITGGTWPIDRTGFETLASAGWLSTAGVLLAAGAARLLAERVEGGIAITKEQGVGLVVGYSRPTGLVAIAVGGGGGLGMGRIP
jgi:hypothetical protein